MSAWKLDHSSNNRLQGVHPDLIRVVQRAAKDGAPRFRVIEGLRTVARQRELVARGASRTMNSRHLTGHAVDLVPLDDNGNPSWDWPLYYPLAKAIKEAARKEGVPLEWGGDWRKFKDGPHWQLPWDKRPTKVPAEVAKAPPATERKESDLSRSRTVAGGGLAGAGGAAVVINEAIVKPLQDAQDAWSTGALVGLVIGGLILIGAGIALYARWDDAGRPLPWR